MPVRRLAVLAAASLLVACPVTAADHNNLEGGLPVTVRDAYTIKRNALEFQGAFRYDSTHNDSEGKDRFGLIPRLEYGLIDNLQIEAEVPWRLGTASDTRQGDLRFGALYNFNTEGVVLPAFAMGLAIDKPVGRNPGGVESELSLAITKSLGGPGGDDAAATAYVPRRLHLNAAWFHNYEPQPYLMERQDRYRVVLGYSQPISNDLLLVVDALRETARERDFAHNLLEAGLRYQLTPQTVLVGGLGAGIGDDRREDFRVIIGFQHTLSFP